MSEATTVPRTQMLLVTEVAEQLRISRSQVYNLIRAGLLAVIRLPTKDGEEGDIRIEQTELDAFIERQRAAASP